RGTCVDQMHRWCDHWLHGVRNDIMRDPRAAVQGSPTQWITDRDWPAPRAHSLTLRPSADGSLRPQSARKATPSFTDVAMTDSHRVSDVGTANPGRIAYTSGPLPLNLRLSGTPVADLRVKLVRPTANLTALLV